MHVLLLLGQVLEVLPPPPEAELSSKESLVEAADSAEAVCPPTEAAAV
ncbi:hypothetical protein EV210_10547 [Anaerospora hongkongensis]|uniref:Uncharacterized protein n=1 Tax=Anaerospora hongkongensis TaxID=244830 RepID=A0A4R1Q0G6_9FIRM|nr:hypothetical protein EV210_10547 [Anaerospora hongkongensis]